MAPSELNIFLSAESTFKIRWGGPKALVVIVTVVFRSVIRREMGEMEAHIFDIISQHVHLHIKPLQPLEHGDSSPSFMQSGGCWLDILV